jgi:eukaryotic-like serine/threonine-protein kinase
MSARVRVDQLGDGLVALKSAIDEEDTVRLLREAAVLAVASHPGVVVVQGVRDAEGRPALATSWVGARSLADVGSLPPHQVAATVSAVASTVADLHELGIVHGQLGDPSHVLLDTQGRPVLCGFGRARLIDRGSTLGHADHGAPCSSDRTPSPSDDVAGLGSLLGVLLEAEPLFEFPRTRRAARRAAGSTDDLRRALLTLADHASADDQTCRPTARALAASLQRLAPEASLPADTTAPTDGPNVRDDADDAIERLRATVAEPTGTTARWRRRAPAIVGALVASLVVALTVGVLSPDRTSGGLANGPPRPADTTTAAASPSRSRPSTTSSPPPTAPAELPTAPDPTQAATVGATGADSVTVIELDGQRYEVGVPGDQVLVDDLACDGRRRAALLRPSTGEVYVFDSWAQPGIDLVARPLATLEPAARIDLDHSDPGCPRLIGVLADGRVVPLPEVGA